MLVHVTCHPEVMARATKLRSRPGAKPAGRLAIEQALEDRGLVRQGDTARMTGRWSLPLLVALVVIELAFFGGYLWISRPQTRFASGFSEEGFRNLKLGVAQTEVVRVLGPPLSRREGERLDKTETIVWYYTEPMAKSFKHRALVFDRSQLLIERVSL